MHTKKLLIAALVLALASIITLTLNRWSETEVDGTEAISRADKGEPQSPVELPRDNTTPGEGLDSNSSEDEYETVHGLIVRKDRDCTVTVHYVPNEDGTVSTAHSCIPNSRGFAHPYESYSSEALLELSYGDAKAAEILGLRMREIDRELSLKLIVRASALLGGDSEVIQLYSNAYPEADMINGEPVLETVQTKYVLSKVASHLGAELNNLMYWEERVEEAFPNYEEALAEFNRQALLIVQEMQSIETEVKGQSTIGVPGGAR